MNLQWKYFVLTMLSFFFPALALADTSSSISFSPPASDISVTFLGNLFGMVDGVLHGTGSQIMGAMFGVFNAAVLALGGIVVMYIILVSTMNTAHEGQMLGQKWSSIWVPIRATMGLSFLIPKASGYCLMQIFVMWVVLQGVGVADKIWGAALDYLNSGGVIIQANMAPDISMGAANSEVVKGAANMLYGQVCMAGLQKQLETLRTNYLAAKEKGSGECSGTPSTAMATFCEQSVPNFIDTVSPLTAYNAQHNPDSTTQETFTISMPSITDSDSIYASLTGICGTINWNGLPPADVSSVTSTISSTSAESIQASRTAAVEQMYLDLLTTAKSMVNNDPQINTDAATDDETSAVAVSQFGVAQTSDGVTCTSLSDDCPNWGADSTISTPVLLEGTELQDAVADYNAIMASTLNLINSASDGDTATKERAFISTAEKYGWIMAGSYFFDLALLNGSATSSTTTDSDTGLSDSSFNVSFLTDAFSSSTCDGTYAALCNFFTITNTTPIENLVTLINGQGLDGMTALSATDFSQGMTGYGGVASSTVFGYAANAALIDLPGQEGTAVTIDIKSDVSTSLAGNFQSPSLSFKCSSNNWFHVIGKCLPNMITKSFWQDLMSPLITDFISFMKNAIQNIVSIIIVYPMVGFSTIFQNGTDILTTEGINPIIALAQMGQTYIDFAMDVWILLAVAAIPGSFLGPFYALMLVAGPIFFAWLSTMVGIGFLTTYFIPFMPYMIFTFGTIAWLITVIEAMVAAPIVALGIAHPEGHDALGKSEAGFMILLNVFLRPGMMIIGYIAGISLSFVGVWIMSAGFSQVLTYLQGDTMWAAKDITSFTGIPWTQYFGMFFAALMFVMLYLTIVQKSFTLIAVLPDKVLRWIGGQPESAGQDAQQWGDEAKGKIAEAGKETGNAGAATSKALVGGLGEVGKKGAGMVGGALGMGKASSTGKKEE